MKNIILTLTFLAFGLASYANSIVIFDQECKDNTIKSTSSEQKQQFDDFFEFVELSIVVEDYEYKGIQTYSLNPTLKLRPIKGKTLPKKYMEQLTLEVEYGILSGQKTGIHEMLYNTVNVVRLFYTNPRDNQNNLFGRPFIKEEFYFNPTTMVDEDGTISIKSSGTKCFVNNLDVIKNANGILLKSVWLRQELLWNDICSYIEPCNGNFIINATGYIQKANDEKAAIQASKGLKSYKGKYPMRTPSIGEKEGDVEYYYRNAPDGQRIYEDTFIYKYQDLQTGYYYNVTGRFKNNKQVGLWHFVSNDYRVSITFNEEGIPDGAFDYQYEDRYKTSKYSGKFVNGYMKELNCNTSWGYFNEYGKPNGEWVITSRNSPVSRVIYENGVCTKPYYFENRTGDKKSIPEWVIELPRKERMLIHGYLRQCLFRDTPRHYFSVNY